MRHSRRHQKPPSKEGSSAGRQPTVRRRRHEPGERHRLGVRGRARPLAAVAAADSWRDPGDVIRSARGREVYLAGGRTTSRPGTRGRRHRVFSSMTTGLGECWSMAWAKSLACADGRATGQIVSAILPVILPDSSSSWALAASARPRVAWRWTRSFPDSARPARASRAG